MSTSTHSQPQSVEHYLKIWATVLILFIVSIAVAQVSHNRPFVLITAFGIAIIQVVLVAGYFMHLKEEQSYIWYLLSSMLLAIALFYVGTMTDVNSSTGQHWVATDTTRLIQEHEGMQVTNQAGELSAAHSTPHK